MPAALLPEHVRGARHAAKDPHHVRDIGVGSGADENGDSAFEGHDRSSVGRRRCCLSASRRSISAMQPGQLT